MNIETLFHRMERINAVASLMYDKLEDAPQLQALLEIIIEASDINTAEYSENKPPL